jgi:hypothetical protein
LESWIRNARLAREAGDAAGANAVARAEKAMLLAVSGGLMLRIFLSMLFQLLAVTVFRTSWSAGTGLLIFACAKTVVDVAGQAAGQYLQVARERSATP